MVRVGIMEKEKIIFGYIPGFIVGVIVFCSVIAQQVL